MNKEEIIKEFREKFCYETQSIDGKRSFYQLLNEEDFDTIPEIENFWLSKLQSQKEEIIKEEREQAIAMFDTALTNAQAVAKHNAKECWCCRELEAIKKAAKEDLDFN